MAFDPELADRVHSALVERTTCDEAGLGEWLDRALAFVATLPVKRERSRG